MLISSNCHEANACAVALVIQRHASSVNMMPFVVPSVPTCNSACEWASSLPGVLWKINFDGSGSLLLVAFHFRDPINLRQSFTAPTQFHTSSVSQFWHAFASSEVAHGQLSAANSTPICITFLSQSPLDLQTGITTSRMQRLKVQKQVGHRRRKERKRFVQYLLRGFEI